MNRSIILAALGFLTMRAAPDGGGAAEESDVAAKAAAASQKAADAAAHASQVEQEAARLRQEAESMTQRAATARADANRLAAAAGSAQTVAQNEEDADMVIANVPRTFQLRLEDHSTREIKAGTQRIPRKHAEHWYAKNHGVTIVSDAARATVAAAPVRAGAGPMTETQKEVSQLQAAAGTVQVQPGAEGGTVVAEWPGSPGAASAPVIGGAASGAQTAGQPAPAGSGSPMSPQGPSEAGLRTATSEAQFRAAAEGKPAGTAVDATRAAVNTNAPHPLDHDGDGKKGGSLSASERAAHAASDAGAPRDSKPGHHDSSKSGKKS